MQIFEFSTGFALACVFLVPLGYGVLYLALRAWGKLNVSGGGWQAAGVDLGGTVMVTALVLFHVFAVPMRWESGLRRRLGGAPGADDRVSDVVVDLVRMA